MCKGATKSVTVSQLICQEEQAMALKVCRWLTKFGNVMTNKPTQYKHHQYH